MTMVGEVRTAGFDGYLRPRNLSDALAAMASGEHLIIAGGTDIYPSHVGRPLPHRILDISAVSGLRGVSHGQGHIRIGALTTWSDIVRANLPPAFRALKQAARQVGSIQVQNRGTVAGNLCNASPAADGVPPLLVLDAEVELASRTGVRRLPLSAFITGYRKTARRADELMTAVLVPQASCTGASSFVKLGSRKYLVISIVMAAARIARDANGAIQQAAIAVGAASAVAQRLPHLERALQGLPSKAKPSSVLRPEHLAALSPISDVRATADYRSDAALALIASAIDEAGHD